MKNTTEKMLGRIKCKFTTFEWKWRKQAYVECKIKRKVPTKRGWFEMKEFTFNWNSLHTESGHKKDFSTIPEYDNPYWPAFLELYKDFWIMPIEKYKMFYL